MREEWRAAVGLPGYEVSDQGRVRALARVITRKDGMRLPFPAQMKKTRLSHLGYTLVKIGGKYRLVHRMVLMAFRGPPPAGHIAAHNNGDRSDARLVNLRWATHVENAADKKLHGTAVQGSSHWAAKLTEQQVIDIRERLAAGEKCVPLGKEYGVAFTAIQRIGSGEIWAHIGGPRTRRFRDRLTADQVRQIRRLAEKSSRREIARRFGVPYTTVGRIVSGVSYATVR